MGTSLVLVVVPTEVYHGLFRGVVHPSGNLSRNEHRDILLTMTQKGSPNLLGTRSNYKLVKIITNCKHDLKSRGGAVK